MDADQTTGIIAGAGLLLVALVLGSVWIWSRRGRSARARWWVRKEPIAELYGRR